MLITFDESLITGNATIDEQHKALIQKISDLVTTCENGDGKVSNNCSVLYVVSF